MNHEASAKDARREEIMDAIRRRTFVRGAAAGALAFTVGGAEVLLLPKEVQGDREDKGSGRCNSP